LLCRCVTPAHSKPGQKHLLQPRSIGKRPLILSSVVLLPYDAPKDEKEHPVDYPLPRRFSH